MKTQKWMGIALIAFLAVTLLQSCSKEDEMTPQIDQPGYTVRPDFALLDNRPPEVIAQFQVTGDDAEPVMLLKSAQIVNSDKYAVIIGISDYTGERNDLEYCDDDARDWKDYLISQGFNTTKITLLLDTYATKANIELAVKNLAALSLAGNEIVFIYSGHGSKGNIVSADLYYIASSWFKTTFSNAKSVDMFFSFDACQIGAMGTDLNATGRVIALASNKTSYSYDGTFPIENGIFTHYQMEGFKKMGYIFVEPDCQYACDQMLKWAKANRVKVVPSFVDSYTGNFDL